MLLLMAGCAMAEENVRGDEGLRSADSEAEYQTGARSLPAILVVEDNIVNQRLAQAQLVTLGFESDVAGSGSEALEAMARRRYQVVLMDCQMPGMDGYQATAEIRKREAGAGHRTVVIAMTAHALGDARSKCFDAGMDDYISKPVEIEALEAALKRWSPVAAR